MGKKIWKRISLISITDGWLVNWSARGGLFKEWVRSMELSSVNHGWIYSLFRQPVYFWDRVRHVASWIPFLWSDHDWDYAYLWLVMREKLRRMRRCHEKEHMIESWDKIANEIKVAEEILTRLIEDDYISEEWAAHEARWGSNNNFIEKNKNGNFVLHLTEDPECAESIHRMSRLEVERREADAENLGKHIAKHCWDWWT